MSEIEFPDVYRAELDPPTLRALFSDLATHAEVIDVRAKAGARRYAGEERLSLRDAEALLGARAVRGIQVRYRHDGALWMDTLMAGPTKVRLVRMKVPERRLEG